MRGKEDAYVDVVAQELKRECCSLSTYIAVCYVRLDAQNTSRIRVGRSHGLLGGGTLLLTVSGFRVVLSDRSDRSDRT